MVTRAPSDGDPRADSSPAYERIPPHNLEAEESVLGSMLLSKNAIAEVLELLAEDDFYRPAHRAIFATCLAQYSKGEPVDPVTVATELQRRGRLEDIGGAPFLHTLVATVPTAANAGYYAQIVRDAGTLRRLIDAGTRIVQLGFERGQDIESVVDSAESLVYQVAQGRVTEDYLPLREILTDTLEAIERLHNEHRELTGVPTGFDELDRITSGLQPSNMIIIAARPGVGKALALDTPLPTPSGWTTMADVKVGDELIGADGRPTRVVAATAPITGRPCFEVVFSDGAVIAADAEHQWVTSTRSARRWARHGRAYSREPVQPAVVTTLALLETLHCETADQRANHSVALAAPFELPDADLLVHPYALGIWLGDGSTGTSNYTSADPEVASTLEDLGLSVRNTSRLRYTMTLPKPPAIETRVCAECGRAFRPSTSDVMHCGRACGGGSYHRGRRRVRPTCRDCGRVIVGTTGGTALCQSCLLDHGSVKALLRKVGVLHDKHIPAGYMRASEDQRRALLAGLLDSDGTVTTSGRTAQFANVNRRLAYQVRELVVSLGYQATLTTKRVRGRRPETSICYTINFAPRDQVFRLSRKALRLKLSKGPRARQRYVVDVRSVESVPVRCVQVSAANGLFLAGDACIPTHNSTLGLDVARNAAVRAGVPTVVFSLEMSRTELVQRLMCAECSVDMQRLRTGRMDEADWAKLTRSLGRLAEAPLFIDDSPGLTMLEIRAKCRRLKQRSGLGLVVVDYLQLMQPTRRSENRQQEVSDISRSMKLLAKELEIPVIAISQLSRQPESRSDRRPLLSDLRESGSLEQDSDLVLLIYRDELYDPESTRKGEADFILAKHRNGPTDTVVVTFQGQYSRFVRMPPRSI